MTESSNTQEPTDGIPEVTSSDDPKESGKETEDDHVTNAAVAPSHSRILLRALRTGLARDRVVRTALGIPTFVLPLCFWVESVERPILFHAASVLLCATALWALARDRQKIQLMEERRFWEDLYIFFVGNLIAGLLAYGALVFNFSSLTLFADGFRTLSFFGFFLALERRPELEGVSRPTLMERRVIYLSGLLFFAFLFLEIRIFPALAANAETLPRLRALLLFLPACYFFFMFFQHARKSISLRWSSLRGLFATVFLFQIVAAFCIFLDAGEVSVAEFFLLLSFALAVLCIRMRHFRFPEVGNVGRPDDFPIPIGQTMIVALLCPFAHFLQEALTTPQVPVPHRQILLIATLLFFAPLALTQHRLLEQRTLELRRERERTERALRRSERKIHLMIQRQKSEETIRRSEEKFTRVFRSAPEVMVISSLPDGTILDINRDAELVLGYHREELLGQTVPELAIWSDPEDRNVMLERLRRDGAIFGLEVEFRTKSGTLRLGILSAQTSEINGRPCLISVLRNITQSRRGTRGAEEQILLLNRSRSAVWILDQEGRFEFWNPAAEKLYGYSVEAVVGRLAGELFSRYEQTFDEARAEAEAKGSWYATLPLAEDSSDVYLQWVFLDDQHLVFSDLAPDPMIDSAVDFTSPMDPETKRQETVK